MKTLKDLIILGRAFPQHLKDGRISCCTACWSNELGFVRLYPTNWLSKKLNAWNVIDVNVEDEKGDWRKESYKIINSKKLEEADNQITLKGKLSRNEKINLLHIIIKTCPEILNEKKLSLGIANPIITGAYFSKNKKGQEILRIKYLCNGKCLVKKGFHDSEVLEWGVYEFLRKNPNKKNEIINNLHLFDPSWIKYFLIGNGYHAPRGFMIISILRFKKEVIHGEEES